jgi:transposase
MDGVENKGFDGDDVQRLAQIQANPQQALQHIRYLESKVAKLEEEKRLDRAQRFGASSEAGDHQYRLFDEAEAHQQESEALDGADLVEVGAHTKRRPKRKPLPADVPRVVVTHELPEAEQRCGCGCQMQVIGEKVSEQLDVIPAQVYVLEHHRPTYSCPTCDESIKTTPMPAQPIPKSLASPGLLAHVAVAKYADGLPLYRQSKQFERLGIDLPRNTLAMHMVKVGELVDPVIGELKRHVLDYDLVGMDETPVQVLKEPGKPAQSMSYMWVMKGGPPRQPALLYHYAPSRAQSVPEQLLAEYAGYLQTDGYAGYNAVLANEAIIGLGCWAHVRRKFTDAKKALPKAQQNKGNRVQQALSFIGKLYQLERAIQGLEPGAKQRRRQADATVILERFKAWLTKQSVPPKTLLGKAIGYALREWPRLVVYTTDGRLSIDNNLVENAIRPFAIGRKAWLFSDSQAGARASANLYSLIETAKANGINDYAYLKWVFSQLPSTQPNDLQRLLPWNVDAADLDAQLKPPS